MGEMSKSPEEIKKDLAAWGTGVRIDIGCGEFVPPTPEYMLNGVRSADVCRDALAYIQRLEEQNSELVRKTEQLQSSMDQVQKALQDYGFGSLEELLQAYSQLKRERDAAVADARGRCFSCRHGGVDERDEPCRTCLFETEGCISDKPAWEWRGVSEPPKQEGETMYKSPIEIVQTGMQVQMESGIIKALQNVCISVDKAELLKALAYDREQYQKGYADGKKAGHEWISVEDRLPDAKLAVLAYGRRHIRKTETTELPAPHVAYTRGEDEGWFTWDYGDHVHVSHWMPLPEPPVQEE